MNNVLDRVPFLSRYIFKAKLCVCDRLMSRVV